MRTGSQDGSAMMLLICSLSSVFAGQESAAGTGNGKSGVFSTVSGEFLCGPDGSGTRVAFSVVTNRRASVNQSFMQFEERRDDQAEENSGTNGFQ